MQDNSELYAKKNALETAIGGLVRKFTDETGLIVDSIFVDTNDVTTYEDMAVGKRRVVYGRTEVTAKL